LQPRIERASPPLGRFVVRVLTTTRRIVFKNPLSQMAATC